MALVVIHTRTFGIEIDKNVVRGVLSKHYREPPHGTGPSWLTFIGHTKDSLWSVDLFRCESTLLQSFWVLVVMDQFTPRIVGFGIQRGAVDRPALCPMFNDAISRKGTPHEQSKPIFPPLIRETRSKSTPSVHSPCERPVRMGRALVGGVRYPRAHS
ncbi:MAG: hypothetical protein ACI9W2_003036 [Gammaproteobacteria bacterium]